MTLWSNHHNLMTWLNTEYLRSTEITLSSITMDTDYGLEKGMVKQICETTYRNDIAHMTVEIVEPRAVQVAKDVKATFADQLGTVGE